MVKKIATIKLLNLVLLAQLAAGLAALYLNQSFIFFIFAAFALLSRMVLGFFEANLAEGGLIEFSFKRALGFFPVFVLLCAFFGWIFRELLREMVHANTETMSAAD